MHLKDLLNRPSKSTTPSKPSYPDPNITNHLATHLLRLCYRKTCEWLLPTDTNQFLTEVYGSDPNNSTEPHWDWMGCTFSLKVLEHAVSTLHKAEKPLELKWSERRRILEILTVISKRQDKLEQKIKKEQGKAALEVYREAVTARIESEVRRVDGIINARFRRDGANVYVVQTDGAPIVYYGN
ncbi:MAG: hypothetical protein Q9190_007939 [Brigantiaea leucoxantha]